MRHFHDLYAMKHCHTTSGHPRRKIPKFFDGGGRGKRSPTGGGEAKDPRAPP